MNQCSACGANNSSEAITCSSCDSDLELGAVAPPDVAETGAGAEESPATSDVAPTPIPPPEPSAPAAEVDSDSYSMELPRKTRLKDGGFVLGPVIGQGGFGITYQGADTALRRFVAIKELFPRGCVRAPNVRSLAFTGGMSATAFATVKAKFLEEARTIARFNHPSIVRVHAVFEENNTAYMVMEYLEGKTLQALLEEKGALNERDAVHYIQGLGDALATLHNANVIHRDLKPENVIVTRDGRVVLIDFGTARAYAANKTVHHTQILTPGYAPLEQYGREARFGASTDVYALGATLYHCLTGELPPAAPDRSQGVELKRPDQVNPNISMPVSRAVMWALKMNPAERPQSVKAWLDSFEGRATVADPPPLPPPAPVAAPPAVAVAPPPEPAPPTAVVAPNPPTASTATAVPSAAPPEPAPAAPRPKGAGARQVTVTLAMPTWDKIKPSGTTIGWWCVVALVAALLLMYSSTQRMRQQYEGQAPEATLPAVAPSPSAAPGPAPEGNAVAVAPAAATTGTPEASPQPGATAGDEGKGTGPSGGTPNTTPPAAAATAPAPVAPAAAAAAAPEKPAEKPGATSSAKPVASGSG